MAKRLIPTFNRILVEKIIPPSKTNSGILLPEKTSKVIPFSSLVSSLFSPFVSLFL
jgi:co-chaperonin GroES (HSP10)